MELRRFGVLLVLTGFLAACATGQDPAPIEDASGSAAAPSTNNAVIALLDNAGQQHDAGKLESAAATIERALRIEPKNPQLWHRLALVRLEQGQYNLAANLAAKSSSFAATDAARYRVLIEKNREIINQAKRQRS